MRILVTGGAGYIGSVLVPLLLDAGHVVDVVDNFLYGQTSLLDVCHYPGLTVHRLDVRYHHHRVDRLVERAEVVVPLACLTGAPICDRDPDTAKAINLDAIERLVRGLASHQWVLFPTTNSGYGLGTPGVPCTEDSPLQPVSLYGRLKNEAEQFLLEHHPNTITFRLATAFGVSPRMRLDLLVNDFVYRAVTDRYVVLYEADFVRNYIHVRDIARVFLHGLDHFSTMAGQAYNVGLEDANLSKLALCQKIQQHVPEFQVFTAPIGRDPDQRNYLVSNAKLLSAGFVPEWSLDAGIHELIQAYQIVRRTQFGNAA